MVEHYGIPEIYTALYSLHFEDFSIFIVIPPIPVSHPSPLLLDPEIDRVGRSSRSIPVRSTRPVKVELIDRVDRPDIQVESADISKSTNFDMTDNT